jgi:hypothetical protein
VVVHGGKMTQADSSWGEKVITPKNYILQFYFKIIFLIFWDALSVYYLKQPDFLNNRENQ